MSDDATTILVLGERRRESDADAAAAGCAWAERLRDLLVARAPERAWSVVDATRPDALVQQLWEDLVDSSATRRPDWAVLQIGTADGFRTRRAGEVEAGAAAFAAMLERVLTWFAAELPETRVVVVEPALTSNDDSAYNDRGADVAAVGAMAAAAVRVAAEAGVAHLPLHARYQAALARFGREALGRDLVHPNQFGSVLLAEHLLRLILGEEHLPRVTEADASDQERRTWLFIGDSITDCGRAEHRHGLGVGYVRLFDALVRSRRPDLDLHLINRGVGGNVVGDLAARWDEDCLAHEPDLVSIKIGINDCNRHCSGRSADCGPEDYARIYRELLERLRAARGDIPLLLIGPFYHSDDRREDSYPARVRATLPDYIEAARGLARDFDARFIDSHARFATHRRHRPYRDFAPDRVHPTATGVAVLTEAVYDVLVGDD